MKVVYNKLIPFPGFKAINLFGIVFARKGCKMSSSDLRHEQIHTEQMKEMLWIPFYLWYFCEWLVRLCSTKHPYYNISLEREAYRYQGDSLYLHYRKRFAWTEFLKKSDTTDKH